MPLGETLPKGKFSEWRHSVNFDRSEGFSDITDIGGMFAFGATDKIEIFGSLGARRIDVDRVPVAAGGQPQDYLINTGLETGFGDLSVGAKFNIKSQATTGNGCRLRRPRGGEAADGELRRRARHRQDRFPGST